MFITFGLHASFLSPGIKAQEEEMKMMILWLGGGRKEEGKVVECEGEGGVL